MRGVELTHHGGDCTFETILRRYDLTVLELSGPMFDGLYEYYRRTLMQGGREPS
jgi:hypothetical protein